jgi:hypothetical protein
MNSYRGIIADWEAGRAGIVSRGRDSLTLPGHFMAATLAGWTVCTIVTPVELLKAKLQMQTHSHVKQFTGPIDCARQIVRARGVPGLWHAFPATLAFRTWFGSMFLSYEIFLRQFKKRNVSPGTANFWSGGKSSLLHATDTYSPALQVSPRSFSGRSHSPSTSSRTDKCPILSRSLATRAGLTQPARHGKTGR